MTQIADTMIGDRVTVLAIVKPRPESGAAIQEKAKAQGVATIVYLNGAPTDTNAPLFAGAAHSVLDEISSL